MRKVLGAILIALFVVLVPIVSAAHETDQYTVPPGREFADLRFYMSNQIYNRLASAVDNINGQIREAERKDHVELIEQLQTPDSIAAAVYGEFPSVTRHIRYWDNILSSRLVASQFPGMITAYEPESWIYYHWKFIIDPTKFIRQIRTATFMINGTYLGTDKLSHFFDVGYVYYLKYRRSRNKGIDKDESVDRSVHLSAGNNLWFSENRFLGTIITGVRSNADLAANYLGMKFYRNLTEEVRLKGESRPPLLVRQDAYWRLNNHVRSDSDFFSVFISDHLNEALNPNYYSKGMRKVLRSKLKERCGALLKWYRDDQGNPMSKEQFMNINKNLSIYYGEDYGHERDFDTIISIANICFDDNEDSISAGGDTAGTNSKLANTGSVVRDLHQHDSVILRGVLVSTKSGDVNRVDKFGRTALWRAARYGILDEVKGLINDGADINKADIDGETPLNAAVRLGHRSVAEFLLFRGADVNSASQNGMTPLHLAVRKSDEGLVKTLLNHGADANATDIFGCTPFLDSVSRESIEVMDLLLTAGADLNAKDINGTSPLHRAARAGRKAAVKKLVSLGVDKKSVSFLGRTPFDEAVLGNHTDVEASLSSQ